MQTINSFKSAFVNAAKSLKGYAKRLFMAQTVEDVFGGKAYRAEIALGWNRQTITKGLRELRSNLECIDGRRGLTGRKSIEVKLPNLLLDIQDLIDSQSQTDARFRTNRLYTRMSAAEVRKQLMSQKGYKDSDLPTEQAIRNKLNKLGYHPVQVQKTQVKKKSQKQMPFSKRSSALEKTQSNQTMSS